MSPDRENKNYNTNMDLRDITLNMLKYKNAFNLAMKTIDKIQKRTYEIESDIIELEKEIRKIFTKEGE
jgi:hypothetical protein